MFFTAKLLLAQRTMDIQDPDGTRIIQFTIEIPSGMTPWKISIEVSPDGKISVVIEDEGISRFSAGTLDEVRQKLMARVDAIRPEIVALKKFPHLKVEQILSNMRSQIVACFAEIDPPKQKPWWKGTK